MTLAFAATGCATTAQPGKLCDEACVKASENNLKAAEINMDAQKKQADNLEATRVTQIVGALMEDGVTPSEVGLILRIYKNDSDIIKNAVNATLAKQGWSVVGETCLAKNGQIVCP